MTLPEFKAEMRANRGRLSSKAMENALNHIYTDGSADFAHYVLRTKKFGIENASNIIDKLTKKEQTDLVKWIERRSTLVPVHTIEWQVEQIIEGR